MTMTQICTEVRKADRAPRFRNAALASLVARALGLVKRYRQIRKSEALLKTFNDHALADIGLRRDRADPGAEVADLLAYGGDGRTRLTHL
jgi:uncharacterized protein YjiS (DUF1127 family)